MNDGMNPETGEYPITNGARASRYASEAHVARRALEMGHGETQLFFALREALENIPTWVKAESDGQRSKYASLKQILEAVREPLFAQGIIILHGQERSFSADEGAGSKTRMYPVFTDLVHVPTGAIRRTTVEIPVARLDAQSAGSALTYGRRYSLLAALGLASDEADDDGQNAMPRKGLAAQHAESEVLTTLKSEMDSCKDSAALQKLACDSKFKKRSDQLSEEELGMLRAHFSSKMAELP